MPATVAVLECADHPDASRAVLEQLEHPTSPAARAGALLAAVRKLRLGHFTPEQSARLHRVVREISGEPLAAEVAAPESRPVGPRAELVRRVVERTAAPDDPLLPRLVGEMLYAAVAGDRFCAATLVRASPYRAGAARAVAGELSRHRVVVDDPGLAERLLVTLRTIGGSSERPLVERLALDPGIPVRVARGAAYAIAHLTGDHGQPAAPLRYAGRPGVLEGLVYTAGMQRSWTALAALRARPELPAEVRMAATWWLNLPTVVVRSATF